VTAAPSAVAASAAVAPVAKRFRPNPPPSVAAPAQPRLSMPQPPPPPQPTVTRVPATELTLVPWREPEFWQNLPETSAGEESAERAVQASRVAGAPRTHYIMESVIPDSPAEPAHGMEEAATADDLTDVTHIPGVPTAPEDDEVRDELREAVDRGQRAREAAGLPRAEDPFDIERRVGAERARAQQRNQQQQQQQQMAPQFGMQSGGFPGMQLGQMGMQGQAGMQLGQMGMQHGQMGMQGQIGMQVQAGSNAHQSYQDLPAQEQMLVMQILMQQQQQQQQQPFYPR